MLYRFDCLFGAMDLKAPMLPVHILASIFRFACTYIFIYIDLLASLVALREIYPYIYWLKSDFSFSCPSPAP